MTDRLLGAIEAGGTKFVLAVGSSPTDIRATHSIPTQDPATTLEQACTWLESHGTLGAIGIASFGPVELDHASSQRGHILSTPKPGWSEYDLAGHFTRAFGVPVGFDTDVNGAALGEYVHGAGRGARSLTYVTVGTGIGGGTVIDGRIVHGAGHPELGHIFPRRPGPDTGFEGVCPFHRDCLEGLASGPAIRRRWGATLSELPADHEAHGLVSEYIAQMCHTVFAALATEVIVLGGGVMKTPGLIERIKGRARKLDAGYLPGGERMQIVPPALEHNAGITGAMLLAETARREKAEGRRGA